MKSPTSSRVFFTRKGNRNDHLSSGVTADQNSKRIIGFAVRRGNVYGEALYSMFREVIAGIDGDLPNQQTSENNPKIACLENDAWESPGNGKFQIPKAA